MKSHLFTGLIALGCVLLASCYPYNERPGKKPTKKQDSLTLTTAERKKIQEDRNLMKAKNELKKKQLADGVGPGAPDSTTDPAGTTPKPNTSDKKAEYKFAAKVPGKEGFVFSPYNNKIVDVRDMPSGTLVQDPTFTGAGTGYFRVP